MPDPRHALGSHAEEAAAAWLSAHGWTILARRWRCPEGELDLVTLDPGGVLVAIEVKLRSTGRAGDPLQSIDRHRLRRLRAALGRYRAGMPGPIDAGMRIDLVALRPCEPGTWRLAHHPAIDAW
jgi:putative endonuclease